MHNDQFIPAGRLKTAVLFLIFNRLKTTKEVFSAIAQAKPPKLYIAADGARDNKEGEADKVDEVRDYVMKHIDWDCNVQTLFRDKNLGCKHAVSGAIDWFFDHEEMGVILEDDCLPTQSFFWFCEELLDKFKDDDRIMHIGGTSTITPEIHQDSDSYYFSKFNHIWGWASWKRAWKFYDVNIPTYKGFKSKNIIKNIIDETAAQNFWSDNFDKVYSKKLDTWDFQWYYTTWTQNGLSILPTVNLVSNIGFGADATHTLSEDSPLSNLPATNIYSLNHPELVVQNKTYDAYNTKILFNIPTSSVFKSKIKKTIRLIYDRRS